MKKLILFSLIAVFVCSGCDLVSNENPNSPSQASPPQLIGNAMLSLPGLSSSPQGEYNAQYLSELIYIDGSLYQEGATSFYGWYQGPLINLKTAQDNAVTANQAAVARILKSYFYWNITDRWGDIPYTEALNGTDDFTPVYDTQESIYDNLFAELKSAGDQLELSGSLRNDIIYGGDMDKWRKLSNTLRLLMALRLSEVDPDKGQQEFQDALNDGILTSNDDNFVFQHLANANNENYWYNQVVRQSREWWALSEGLVELMKPVDDPRLPVYGDQASSSGEYIGLTFGSNSENQYSAQSYSLLGADIHEQGAPVYLVTYAEALFAKAEAAERGWISEDAETNYNMAVSNSIMQWTENAADGSDFLNQPEVAYDASNGIEQIVTQRYVHLFMHGYEACSLYRRTGFPSIMESPQGREVPLRQIYTSDEQLNNTENYEEAVQRQFGGENTLYGQLWWDKE
jgi:hypothetical protein